MSFLTINFWIQSKVEYACAGGFFFIKNSSHREIFMESKNIKIFRRIERRRNK
jgi:hypothetical protein